VCIFVSSHAKWRDAHLEHLACPSYLPFDDVDARVSRPASSFDHGQMLFRASSSSSSSSAERSS